MRRPLLLCALAGALLGAAPQVAQAQLPEGHAPVSDEQIRRLLGEGPPLSAANPDPAIPAGIVEVQVVGPDEAPLDGVQVRLGTMRQGQRATPRLATTSGGGLVRFTLTGEAAGAHRVSIEFEGVKVSTAPFTLEGERGVRVVLRKLPVSHDTRLLLLRAGQLVVEWKTGRMRLSQTLDLIHLGDGMLALGDDGLRIPLPDGATAFATEPSMNDQRLAEMDGAAVLTGSLPPGPTTVTFTYDLPIDGATETLRVPVPFEKTASYQVVVDASEAMRLSVEGFSEARRIAYQGRELLVSEVERTPDQPPLGSVEVRIEGIAGSNPARELAIGAAGLLAVFGVGLVLRRRKGEGAARPADDLAGDDALYDELLALEASAARGDVGPSFLARETERLVDELAARRVRRAG